MAVKQARDDAIGSGDDHEIALIRVARDVGNRRLVELERPADRLEVLQPARELDALVDGLSRPIEARRESERELLRRCSEKWPKAPSPVVGGTVWRGEQRALSSAGAMWRVVQAMRATATRPLAFSQAFARLSSERP